MIFHGFGHFGYIYVYMSLEMKLDHQISQSVKKKPFFGSEVLGARWGRVRAGNRCRNTAGVFPSSVRWYFLQKTVEGTDTECLNVDTSSQVPPERVLGRST